MNKQSLPLSEKLKPRPKSVVRGWVLEIPYTQQAVLLAAVRGCDSVPKEDPSKPFVRYFRWCILHNAKRLDGDLTGFMRDSEPSRDEWEAFIDSLDHYPVHWLLHFAHAAEIVGYKCPVHPVNQFWLLFYNGVVRRMHLKPETDEELDIRHRPYFYGPD